MVLNLGELDFNRRWKWYLRPRQSIGVTVEDYYTQFCDWKEEMIILSIPAEEEDYVDGFIENLAWDIRSRVASKWRFCIHGLSDAFSWAKWEESMLFFARDMAETFKANLAEMVATLNLNTQPPPPLLPTPEIVEIDEMAGRITNEESYESAQNRRKSYEITNQSPSESESEPPILNLLPDSTIVDVQQAEEQQIEACIPVVHFDPCSLHSTTPFTENQIEEMDSPTPIEIPGDANGVSIEENFVEKKYQDEANSMSTTAGLQSPPINKDHNSAISTEIQVVGVITNVQRQEMAECCDLGKNDMDACMVFTEMPILMRQPHSLKIDSLKDAPHLFDAMPSPISIRVCDENDSHGDLVAQTIGLLNNLSSGDAVPEFRSVNFEGLQKIGLLKMMFGEMFDPGISSGHHKGCACIKSDGVKHEFDKIPTDSNVEAGVGMVLMLVFDPGGSSLYRMSYQDFEYWVGMLDVGSDYAIRVGRLQSRELSWKEGLNESVTLSLAKVYKNTKPCTTAPHIGMGQRCCELSVMENSADFDDTIDVKIVSLLPSTCLRILDHFHEARILRGQNVVLIMATTFENFVWHPGLCAIFLLILEDKDVLKREGIGVRLATIHDEWLNGAAVQYNAHKELLACFLVDWELLLIFITSPKSRTGKSYSLMGPFITFCRFFLNSFLGNEQSLLGDFKQGDSAIGNHLNMTATVFISNHHMFIEVDVMRFKRFDEDSCSHFAIKNLINNDTAGDTKLIPRILVLSTSELEHYIWDPGSSVSVLRFDGDFYLTTLRTRWLLRGRICHDINYYYIFICISEFMYLAVYDVIY